MSSVIKGFDKPMQTHLSMEELYRYAELLGIPNDEETPTLSIIQNVVADMDRIQEEADEKVRANDTKVAARIEELQRTFTEDYVTNNAVVADLKAQWEKQRNQLIELNQSRYEIITAINEFRQQLLSLPEQIPLLEKIDPAAFALWTSFLEPAMPKILDLCNKVGRAARISEWKEVDLIQDFISDPKSAEKKPPLVKASTNLHEPVPSVILSKIDVAFGA